MIREFHIWEAQMLRREFLGATVAYAALGQRLFAAADRPTLGLIFPPGITRFRRTRNYCFRAV
jgi:hypothetical protein